MKILDILGMYFQCRMYFYFLNDIFLVLVSKLKIHISTVFQKGIRMLFVAINSALIVI